MLLRHNWERLALLGDTTAKSFTPIDSLESVCFNEEQKIKETNKKEQKKKEDTQSTFR